MTIIRIESQIWIWIFQGGQHMVTFMNYYGADFLLYLVCMMEVIAVAWCYGLHKFIRDIEFMLGVKIGWYWIICWGGIIPVGLLVVLVYTLATAKPLTQNGMEFPEYMTSKAGIFSFFLKLLETNIYFVKKKLLCCKCSHWMEYLCICCPIVTTRRYAFCC